MLIVFTHYFNEPPHTKMHSMPSFLDTPHKQTPESMLKVQFALLDEKEKDIDY